MLGRHAIGTELSRDYIQLGNQRIREYATGKSDRPAIKPLPGQLSLLD
jgi:hypothetical protein